MQAAFPKSPAGKGLPPYVTVHQTGEALDQIVDIAEGTRLRDLVGEGFVTDRDHRGTSPVSPR